MCALLGCVCSLQLMPRLLPELTGVAVGAANGWYCRAGDHEQSGGSPIFTWRISRRASQQ